MLNRQWVNTKIHIFGKEFEIEAAQKNDKLQSVYIGIEAKDAKYAFISVDGKDLELF